MVRTATSKALYGVLLVSLCAFGLEAYAAKYIVTLKDGKTFQQLKNNQTGVQQMNTGMGFMNAGAKLNKSLDNLNMFIVESKDDISFLKENPHILDVEKEELFAAPKQISTKSNLSSLNALVNTEVERPWGIDAVNAPTAWDTTQGEGITVLVIDSGLDKDHPALAGRLIEGKNFFARSPSDDAPYDFFDDIGHGTHVAGTVLADGVDGRLVGVAPKAKLYMGRVCGSFGCSPIAIAEAINWGIDNKVNVMNLSLGGSRISRTERLAFQRAEEFGITVVAASGNSGTGKISCPSCVETVIAVGALDENLERAEFSQYGEGLFIMAPGVNVNSAVPVGTGRQSVTQLDLGNGLQTVPSNSFQGASAIDEVVNAEMVYVGLGKTEDYADVDLTGKIALIKRGEITFADKVNGAIKVGAKAAIIFNNEDGLVGGAITRDGSEIGIPVVMVELAQGEKILKVIAEKGVMPTAAVMIEKTDHSPLQGTSMASPHVAGVVALIVGANPNLSPAQVREIIKTTAIKMSDVNQHGHGRIDASAAVTKALTVVGDKVLNPTFAMAN